MARERILLTGGSGLLALNWACAMRADHDVVLATHTRTVKLAGTEAVRLSLDEPQALSRSLERLEADIVVHTAGMANVEDCERDPELAQRVNVELSRHVARAAAAAGARMIHISTDHLFAGTRSFYTEDDSPEPLNAYARTKLAAEEAVAQECSGALIVRTNFFGWGHRYRRSLSDWVYDALTAGRPLTMFDDVYVTPIIADHLARCAHRLLAADAAGVYNVVGDERLSKYAFGVQLADALQLPKSLLRRGKISDSQLAAKRPHDMSLANGKARAALDTSLGSFADQLSGLKQQSIERRRDELLAAVTE